MKWFITGGCGFIGSALTRNILGNDLDAEVRIYDDLSVGSADAFGEAGSPVDSEPGDAWTRLSLVVGEIADGERLAAAMRGADVVVHLAANTGVGPSVEDPMADCITNVVGTLNALEGARHGNVGRFVMASSGAPLGVQVPPLHEEMAPKPASPYGASKLAGEGYCSAYYHCFGVEAVALRFGNVYGPGSTHKSSVVAKFIRLAMAGETLEVYGDGSQTRDFIYLDDLLGAITAAATVDGVGGHVFQIATNAETTVEEMLDTLLEVFEDSGIETPPVVHGPKRQGDVARNYSDTTKAHELLGWQSSTTLREGLAQTAAWFTAQAD